MTQRDLTVKKSILAVVITSAILLSTMAAAEGKYSNYGVIVAPGNFIFGSFNNRFDTTPTFSKTSLGGSYDTYSQNVTFYGRGSDGSVFTCYVQPSSSFYQFAYDTVQNMESTSIAAQLSPGSSECTQLIVKKESSFQH